MTLFKIALSVVLLAGSPAVGDPLAEMEGTWRGSGWAREMVDGPQETVRCQITNTYDVAAMTLTLAGQCVVPGRRLTISGTLTGSDGAERITGRWSNPDGIGSTQIVGLQRDGIVAFNFNALDPSTGRTHAQNVEWRLTDGGLRLRSTDRDDPSVMMSDVMFAQ